MSVSSRKRMAKKVKTQLHLSKIELQVKYLFLWCTSFVPPNSRFKIIAINIDKMYEPTIGQVCAALWVDKIQKRSINACIYIAFGYYRRRFMHDLLWPLPTIIMIVHSISWLHNICDFIFYRLCIGLNECIAFTRELALNIGCVNFICWYTTYEYRHTHACASEAHQVEINSNMFSKTLNFSMAHKLIAHTLWFFHCLSRFVCLFIRPNQPIDAYQHDKWNEANKQK